jgi:tRNA G10  N-methylase Trm11
MVKRNSKKHSKGGFHDIASYRSETGDYETPDSDVRAVLAADKAAAKQAGVKSDYDEADMRQLKSELDRVRAQLIDRNEPKLRQHVIALERALNYERAKRQAYEQALDPWTNSNPVEDARKYLERKQLKREIMEELAEKRKTTKSKTKRKTKSRSKSKRKKSKPKKTKPKRKTKSRSKSKRKTKPKRKTKSRSKSKKKKN